MPCLAMCSTFAASQSNVIVPTVYIRMAPDRNQPAVLGSDREAVTHKKTGQSVRTYFFSVSDLESNRLAGFLPYIWSNLCTRNIRNKLTPRGHHDWPDIRAFRKTHGGKRGRSCVAFSR